MCNAAKIDGWQYPVAESLTTFMIRQSKSNYVAFINAIKDGLSWQESLEQKYHAPLDRLAAFYGVSLNLRGVRP